MAGVPEERIKERVLLWLDYLTRRYPLLTVCRHSIVQAFLLLRESFFSGGKLLVCGNGGSAADAEHISGELMKGFIKKRPIPLKLQSKLESMDAGTGWTRKLQGGLPTIPLTVNGGLSSAIVNDQASELIFAQQVLGYGRHNDSLWALSTSGNSENVVKAVCVAKALGLKTIGLTGAGGGKLKEICDVTIQAPAQRVYQIQELHLPIYHALCAMLEEEFF